MLFLVHSGQLEGAERSHFRDINVHSSLLSERDKKLLLRVDPVPVLKFGGLFVLGACFLWVFFFFHLGNVMFHPLLCGAL